MQDLGAVISGIVFFWGGRGISYDWSVVFKATINQSQVAPVQMIPEITVPKTCTNSP